MHFAVSHYDALLVVLGALGHLAVARGSHIHRRASATDGRLNDCQALLRPFVPGVCGLDVPYVGFQYVAAAAYARLGEVPNRVLRLDVACCTLALISSLRSNRGAAQYVDSPSSAERLAHSYASSSSFSRMGAAPTMYQAHRPIIAAACPRSAAPV